GRPRTAAIQLLQEGTIWETSWRYSGCHSTDWWCAMVAAIWRTTRGPASTVTVTTIRPASRTRAPTATVAARKPASCSLRDSATAVVKRSVSGVAARAPETDLAGSLQMEQRGQGSAVAERQGAVTYRQVVTDLLPPNWRIYQFGIW